MSKFIIILIITTTISCQLRLKAQQEFNKEKWRTSTDYRYEVAKSSYFPDLKGKSKEEVKELLGEPCSINGETFKYCLSTDVNSYIDKTLNKYICDCQAALF
jgi:hypothetical protein